MEMARVCAEKQPAATMMFVATAGEEQGLLGGKHLAKTLKKRGVDVAGEFNNDIVGTGLNPPFNPVNNHTLRLFTASIVYPNATTASHLEEIGIIGGLNDSPARDLGRFISEITAGAAKETDMQVVMMLRQDRYLRGGDQDAFLAQGFPYAVRLTEAVEDFRHQHQDPRIQDGVHFGDLVEFVDFEYAARVARVNLASMWSIANAPAVPKNVTLDQSIGTDASSEHTPLEVMSNDSRFFWNAGNDPMVAGYELVWRYSGALQWSHSLRLGKVDTTTVNLSKDNVQFGIRAVGHNGKKSPAVLPLPLSSN